MVNDALSYLRKVSNLVRYFKIILDKFLMFVNL